MIDGIFIGFCSFAARLCSTIGGRGVFLKERYLFDRYIEYKEILENCNYGNGTNINDVRY